LSASGTVGVGAALSVRRSVNVVVVLGTVHTAPVKPASDFKTLAGVDAHDRFGQFGMKFIKYGFSQTHRYVFYYAGHYAPNGITSLAGFHDQIFHFGGFDRIGTPDDVGLGQTEVVVLGIVIDADGSHLTHISLDRYTDAVKNGLGYTSCRDPH